MFTCSITNRSFYFVFVDLTGPSNQIVSMFSIFDKLIPINIHGLIMVYVATCHPVCHVHVCINCVRIYCCIKLLVQIVWCN